MRALFVAFALGCVGLLLASDANFAQDKKTDKKEKEVVLKGKIACNKCERSVGSECATIIIVKDAKKKEIIYFFDAASDKKYHSDICAAAADGTVVATVKDVDKKKVISVKKLEYAK